MRLHQRVLNIRSNGFTLVELLLAIAIGGTVSWVATDAVMTHLKTNETLDTAIRQREDWRRTSHFIESEVALSERILTSFATASTTHCKNEITASEFRFALDIRRDIKQVIYYVKQNQPDESAEWVGDSSLWRCGPSIDQAGDYLLDVTEQRIIDGLTTAPGSTCNGNVSPDPYGLVVLNPDNNSARKSLTFGLCIKSASQANKAQSKGLTMQTSAYSRVSPIYSYPNNNILCSEQNLTIEGFYKLINERVAGNLLAVPIGEIDEDQPVLICGDGREILGSYSDDVLEGGTSNTPTSDKYVIRGNCGNDRLLGTNNNDTLYGDYAPSAPLNPECNVPFTTSEGEIKEHTTDADILIGNSGNDTLVGGTGDNYYLPGNGNSNVTDDGADFIDGGSNLDVVFMDGSRSDYHLANECKISSCELKNIATEEITILEDVEVIVFTDGRIDAKDD